MFIMFIIVYSQILAHLRLSKVGNQSAVNHVVDNLHQRYQAIQSQNKSKPIQFSFIAQALFRTYFNL